MPWYHEIRRDEWRVLLAAHLGYLLDAMDVLLFSFALTAVRSEFLTAGKLADRAHGGRGRTVYSAA